MTQQATQESPESCLKESIRLLLETNEQALSEYDIIRSLNEQGWGLSLDATESTVLFKTHFLVYHALYELQMEYWQEQQRLLDISALTIGFVNCGVLTDKQSRATNIANDEQRPVSYESHQALRDYYLDLSHLEKATESTVNELLNQFWSRFVASDDKTKALAILDLPANTDLKTLKQRYRALAMEHHPDRGGEAEQFQQINWAFGVLQKALS